MGYDLDIFGCLPIWVWVVIIIVMIAATVIRQAIERSQPQKSETSLQPKSTPSTVQRIKCPFCAELVMPDALTCRFCGQGLSSHELVENGLAAAESGNTRKARHLLAAAIKQDGNNDAAWLGLAQVVEDGDECRAYLEKTLKLNPNNHLARERLEALDSEERKPV